MNFFLLSFLLFIPYSSRVIHFNPRLERPSKRPMKNTRTVLYFLLNAPISFYIIQRIKKMLGVLFMARLIEKLTTLSVKKINKAGDYSDGARLWLRVSHEGAESWMFRFSFEKKEHKMGLGATHTVSLLEAREEARNSRKLLREKINPLQKRQKTVIQEKN